MAMPHTPYVCAKAPSPISAPARTPLEIALSALANLGLTHLEAEDLLTLMPPNPEEDALFIMANVRAYFQGEWMIIPTANF